MKITVGVIFGGESVEHEVSIISASQAMHALDPEKYDVVPLYVSKKRVIYSSKELMDVNMFTNLQNVFDNVPEVYLSYDGNKTYVRPIKQSLFKKWEIALDVVIPVVHGTNCEDGTIQGYLENAEYGRLLQLCFERCRRELPAGFAAFHLPWMLEWLTATRQYKQAYELMLDFPANRG